LQQLANIGEFAGLLGVIFTLLFLVTQIRANTRSVQLSIIDTAYSMYLESIADVNRVPEVAQAVHKAFTNAPLDTMDRHHLTTWLQRVFSVAERSLLLRENNMLDARTLDATITPLISLLQIPAVREVYSRLTADRDLYSKVLRNFVDAEIRNSVSDDAPAA
jgi:hypothetical protein